MALLTKEQILGVSDLPFEDVPTPEWGEGASVRVTTMSALQKEAWESQVFTISPDGKTVEQNRDNFVAKLLSCTIVDESGQRLFASSEDVVELGKKSGKVLTRLYNVARRLNGIGSDEEDAVEKN